MMSDRDILNAMRVHFLPYAMKAFHILNPSQDLNPSSAFLAMAHKLGEVADGRVRRLIINVPPRSGKSLLGSIALPSYVLGLDPPSVSSLHPIRENSASSSHAILAP